MAFSPPGVGCLVKKRLAKGGVADTQDPPGYALVMNNIELYLGVSRVTVETIYNHFDSLLFIACRNTSAFQACGNLLHHYRRCLRISTVSREAGTFF